ncbi:hypothetical protein VTK26DRAFT_3090 [Humicola hyalothermophila]
MSGRGRARPPSRSAQEPAPGPSRRSTRQQQQQQQQQQHQSSAQLQQDSQPESSLSEGDQQQGQLDQQQEQQQAQQHQPEAPMAAPDYHQIIDPAITGTQDSVMPPPPVPAKSMRVQNLPVPARRFTRRDVRAGSMAPSINSVPATEAYSSQPELQSSAPQNAVLRHGFGTPPRAESTASYGINDTPGRKAAQARLMKAMLPRFLTATNDLFKHLCNDSLDHETWEAELLGYKDAFNAYRKHYVSDISEPVVNPDLVVDTMGLDRASLDGKNVFRIVSAANLVSLLHDLSITDQRDFLPLLQEWDSVFPDFFVYKEPGSNDNEANEQIIDQVLMIRTQLSIFTLQICKSNSRAPFNPLEQIAKFWCEGDASAEAIEALSNNKDAVPLRPIPAADREAAALARDRNMTRFTSICRMLPKEPVAGHDLDLSDIQQLYAFGEFVQSLRTFVTTCYTQIRASIQQGSPVGLDLPLSLAPSDAGSRVGSQIRSQLEADAMAHSFDRAESGTPSLSYDMDALRRMKQLEQQSAPAYDDGHPLPTSSYPPAPRIPYPPGFNNPTPSPGLAYPDSTQQSGFPPNGSLYAESAAQIMSRKRASQDDGIPGAVPPGGKRVRKRRRKGDVPASGAAADGSVAASTSGAAPAQSQYPPLSDSQDMPDFDALNQRAKEISAANRKAKKPQERQAWVKKDIHMLIKAVDAYQCKWSTIEKEIKAGTIPFERPRDQQALRDKARLLKQDLLKCDGRLPPGFDLVVLGKKEREAVMACGKNPDRKESDVDANGEPINTALVRDEVPAPVPETMPDPAPQPLPAPQPAALPAPLAPAQPGPEQQPVVPEQQPVVPEPQPAGPDPTAA